MSHETEVLMKKTIKKSPDDKPDTAFTESPLYLQKKILELEKVIAKLQDECISKDVRLAEQRYRILALEKLIPDSIKPKTIEEILRELREKRK